MTQDHPSLTQQIDAVTWAAKHVGKQALDARALRPAEKEFIVRALKAAAEELKTMDFARETLK